MKNNKNSKLSKTTTNRKEYKIESNPDYKDWYFDECWNYYKQHECKKNNKRRLVMYQVRMYRTWKHNRKTQWK